MESNLDDILVDGPENQEKPEKSKRKFLIGLASALLIAVVIMAAYFVVAQKDEPKGLEVSHAELEKFINNHQDQAQKSKTDEEFDKLIAEIQEKDQKQGGAKDQPKTNASQPAQANAQVEQPEEQKQTLIDAKIQELSGQTVNQDAQNNQALEAKQEALVSKEPAQEKSKKQEKVESSKPKTQAPKAQQESKVVKTQEKKQGAKQTKPAQSTQTKSAVQTFNTLKDKIPQGFYLQVGVFGSKPNADFLKKVSNYSYQVEKLDRNGRVVERYLVGPFDTRWQAQEKMEEVEKKIIKSIVVEIR